MNHFHAYAAGLFDGEGSFCLQSMKGGSSFNLRVEIKLSAKHRSPSDVLDDMAETFGGSVQVDRRGMRAWCVTGPAARQFVEACLPYFRVKRPQAETVLRFFTLAEGMRKGAYCRWTDEGRTDAKILQKEISAFALKPSAARQF